MGLKISGDGASVTFEVRCDRCQVTVIQATGGGYIEFRKDMGKVGWRQRRGKWLGPCCIGAQRELDLARTAPAREVSPGRPRHD